MISGRVNHPFAPVYDEHSRVLVLGSMPSPASRADGFYYAHPQNRFWPVMAALWDEPVPNTTDDRRAFCLCHGVALWDVLASCTISGASDASISNPVSNDVATLLAHTTISSIFCTGRVAAKLYHRLIEPECGIACVCLPSTSAANARIGLPALIEAYWPIRRVLEKQTI